ncbi:glycine betaine/carnitine/choline transport system permease protein OpuCD [Peptococcaceae bacterium CEB3]|nr:glycine betaine/carnitine/choline transport system permease protein OpuCD [Peptococcaceae bacterium CEB3]
MKFLKYMALHYDKIGHLLLQHVRVTVISLVLAAIIGIPLGILITKNEKAAKIVLYVAGIIQTVPSIALFGFLIPVLGIGLKPAVVALVLYGQLPIIRNVYTGIKTISPAQMESARGMGMTGFQILRRIQIPEAFPVILGGIRTAAVALVGIAAIASIVGAGGLGDLIFEGISSVNSTVVLAGAIPAALLALAIDYVLGVLERSLNPMPTMKK